MLKKALLLLIIFAGASASVPALRERVKPRVQPVWSYVAREAGTAFEPVLRWSAEQEAQGIARDLRRREAAFLRIPQPGELQEFLARQHYSPRRGIDPWGTPYALILKDDSILIVSAGPDRRRGTPDDMRQGVPRK